MKNLLLTFFLSLPFLAVTQDLSYGFRAGLNLSKTDGPLEENETVEYNSGFHIGFGFGMWFTDIWGARAELVYSQNGAKYRYEGPGYAVLASQSENRTVFTGNKTMTLSATNSYVNIPLTAFARVTRWLEVSAGAYVGFLVNSVATGDYELITTNFSEPLEFELDYNYYGDEAGEADFSNSTNVSETGSGNIYTLPSSAGAYFFQDEKEKSYYKVLDYGLTGGISFYLNRGLYLGGRVVYGLANITNKEADFSQASLDAQQNFITRDDKDKNWSLQASIGFNF